ncbi:hypothetical protein N7476_010278 [Penicillium atrosanguineum]|uniref:Ran-interacting protein Mog1 n=1 Tax=Penicillium atrosanguineum TaxID=1132637 RepID=A0A9W9U1P7_9EURO|nr:hypothetical protein N7526_007557 [Penicillium atrosanguineum]KAJ5303479.1 hypothetical protein N7476_010278 [Penicillium atrosanguineum]
MAQTVEQDFFGGAIRGIVPQRWIDASNLREIPDHQEIFLSPESLSNMIVEINQRVSKEDALSTFATLSHQHPALAAGSGSVSSATPESLDQAAALYHLHDLCDEGDAMQIVTPPQRVNSSRLGVSAPPGSVVSAYKGIVQFKTASRKRGARTADGSNASAVDSAVAGASVDGEAGLTSKMTCHYLLVRLESQETDLLVFFNVPHEEFDKSGDVQGLSKEESVAEETVGVLAEKLEIRDWGLFV